MAHLTVTLRHGTTRHRAEHLLLHPPDANYVETGGDRYSRAEGFSTVRLDTADKGLGTADEYARRKSDNFPDEGGPAVIEIEVPGVILDIIYGDPIGRAAAESGDVRFESGFGLEELCRSWPTLPKRVILL